ncbi:MAG: T9SS type A sorting domain-containing protein, partial [Ignavibacteria bacterium]|nr:T9SS type A sorting domain-containing protein [Ignavibacteria bacterium]
YATIKYIQTGAIEVNEIISLPLAKTSGVEIFPNPAKSVIRVRCPLSVKSIKIYDVMGKVVKEITSGIRNGTQNDNNIRVTLDGIKNGIYFLSIETREKRIIQRFVVIK